MANVRKKDLTILVTIGRLISVHKPRNKTSFKIADKTIHVLKTGYVVKKIIDDLFLFKLLQQKWIGSFKKFSKWLFWTLASISYYYHLFKFYEKVALAVMPEPGGRQFVLGSKDHLLRLKSRVENGFCLGH